MNSTVAGQASFFFVLLFEASSLDTYRDRDPSKDQLFNDRAEIMSLSGGSQRFLSGETTKLMDY